MIAGIDFPGSLTPGMVSENDARLDNDYSMLRQFDAMSGGVF